MLRSFRIQPKYTAQVTVTEVSWVKPPLLWYKVNTDGVSLGQPGYAACGGIFRMWSGFSTGSYIMPLLVQIAIFAEIMGFILSVELAHVKGWFPLWLETNSTVLVDNVKARIENVPWRARMRWRRCISILNVR